MHRLQEWVDADGGRWLRGRWPVEAVAVWALLSAFGARAHVICCQLPLCMRDSLAWTLRFSQELSTAVCVGPAV